MTRATGDQGIDIVASDGTRKLVAQCKRYEGSVGNKAVQEIIAGRVFERAELAAVISTGKFTSSARQLASASGVHLLHPSQIAEVFTLGTTPTQSTDNRLDAQEFLRTVLSKIVNAESEARASELLTGDGDDNLDAYEGLEDNADLDDEALLKKSVEVLRSSKRASTSMLQRRLSIGYNRAARIMDLMEERGIVGPENGSSPREILKDLDTL